MLRIILWRIYFEILCLLKAFGFKGRRSFYFAFGANLDPEVLKRRAIHVYSKEFTWLPDYQLKFNHRVPFKNCGFASIERCEGERVPGVILEISKIDEWRLDCFEAYRFFGRYKKSHALIAGRQCYFYQTGCPKEGIRPTKEYLRKILNGYAHYLKSDSPFVQRLKSIEGLDQMIPERPPNFLIQNYGRPGSLSRHLLERYDTMSMKLFVYFIFRESLFQRWLQ